MAAAVLFVLTAASAIDYEVGALAEARRGEVPLDQGGAPSHPATLSAITPLVGLILNDRDASLRLRYSPRPSWYQIHDDTPRLSRDQPLVLHYLEAAGAWRSE